MRNRSIVVCGLVLSMAGAGLIAQNADKPNARRKAPFEDKVSFEGRRKFDQTFDKVFKISVAPEVLPLDSDTMTAVLNGTTVAGAAAKDVFGLSTDEYQPYVQLDAKVTEKPGSVIAKVEIKIRADARVPHEAVNALADRIRVHMQKVLQESIEIDRDNIAKRQQKLAERLTHLENQYRDVWSNRVRLAEDAGLAEYSVALKRASVADLESLLQDVGLELELRQTRMSFTQKELDAQQSGSTPPKDDPLKEELEKLVRVRARQLEASNNAGSSEDQRDAAEARMLEAKLRWIERINELEELTPENRMKVLKQEVAELETRKSYYERSLSEAIDKTRGLFRYNEQVLLMQKKEERLDQSIERVETETDNLANYSDKLGTITVSIIGQD